MVTKSVLMRAKTLIEQKGWTKLAFARGQPDTNGKRDACCADSRLATEYSADGAIYAAGWPDRDACRAAISSFAESIGRPGGAWPEIRSWNDEPSRTKGDVLAQFDCAISREAAE